MASMEMIIDDRDSESFFREEVDRGRGYSRAGNLGIGDRFQWSELRFSDHGG